MSPSTDRSARPTSRQLLATTAVVAVLTAVAPFAAAADGDASDGNERGTVRITAPEPMGQAVTYPRVDLSAGGVPLTSVSEDLEGTAQVAEAREAVDVVLDGNVLFGKDSAVLRPAARGRLREIIALLRERGPGTVHIVGHTDDLGSAQHGLVLSRERARSVRDVLEPALDGFRVTSEGKGEAEPRVPNRDEASRALNRRVEIHVEHSATD